MTSGTTPATAMTSTMGWRERVRASSSSTVPRGIAIAAGTWTKGERCLILDYRGDDADTRTIRDYLCGHGSDMRSEDIVTRNLLY